MVTAKREKGWPALPPGGTSTPAAATCTLQPPLRAQLLSPLLRVAVGQTVSGDWQQEPIHTQEFSRGLADFLHALLANLLVQSPDTARLQLIMEHLSPWLESRLPQERARALGSTTALLRVATTLPGFDVSDLGAGGVWGCRGMRPSVFPSCPLCPSICPGLWAALLPGEGKLLFGDGSARCPLPSAAPQQGRAGPGPRPAGAGPSAPGIHAGRQPVSAPGAEEAAAASPPPTLRIGYNCL
ncbi:uncharacterized protein LOC142823343 [Pelodiscus sinensis]|uniref:uncharacterized protein LOC142823343 n=1 Tax=Pelodiscus sinensis TaxID=13735 RepID=UPI003F6B40A0